MTQFNTWLSETIEALKEIGGEGSLRDICEEKIWILQRIQTGK